MFFPLLGDSLSTYTEFMRSMKAAGMYADEYAAILTVSHYTVSDVELPWMINGAVDSSILSLFERTIVLVNNYYSPTVLQSFANDFSLNFAAVSFDYKPAKQHAIKTTLVKYAQLYESMFAYYYFLETAQRLSGNVGIYQNSTYIRTLMLNQQIDGPFGKIAIDSNNQRLAPFQAYIVNSQTANLTEFMHIVISTTCGGNSVTVVDNRCLFFVRFETELY